MESLKEAGMFYITIFQNQEAKYGKGFKREGLLHAVYCMEAIPFFFLQTVIKKEQLGGISGKDFFGIQFKSHQTTICLICLTFKSFPFEFPVFYLSLMC